MSVSNIFFSAHVADPLGEKLALMLLPPFLYLLYLDRAFSGLLSLRAGLWDMGRLLLPTEDTGMSWDRRPSLTLIQIVERLFLLAVDTVTSPAYRGPLTERYIDVAVVVGPPRFHLCKL